MLDSLVLYIWSVVRLCLRDRLVEFIVVEASA